jgi:mRNA interferase MazF
LGSRRRQGGLVIPGYLPRRGDLIWLNFTPQAGHEQGGRRPALVISKDEYNRKVGLLLACPITSRKKGYPFEVELPAELPIAGVVLADQVRNLDWKARKACFISQLPDEILAEVLAKLDALIGE